MKQIVGLFFLTCIQVTASAQILKVNKGSLLLDSASVVIGKMGLNFNIHNRSATSEQEIIFVGLNGTTDIVYLSDKHAYISINNIHYYKSTGGPLSSNGYSHFRINILRKNKLSYEGFVQVQYDDGRNMPFRLLGGGGLRFNLIETKKTSVNMGVGGMRERENWKMIEEERSLVEKGMWKTSDYIGINTVFNDIVSFHLIAYYQGGWDSDDSVFRNRISGDFQFAVKVTDKLSFVTNFTSQYEDKPIIPIKNMVYTLTNGINWNF